MKPLKAEDDSENENIGGIDSTIVGLMYDQVLLANSVSQSATAGHGKKRMSKIAKPKVDENRGAVAAPQAHKMVAGSSFYFHQEVSLSSSLSIYILVFVEVCN